MHISKTCINFAVYSKNNMFNIKNNNKKMEKKNYEFKAYDAKGNEIKLKCANIFYDITEEMAQGIRIGIEMGLLQKYKDPSVTYREF